MSSKDNLSGWSKRSGRLPVYHVVSSQDDDFINGQSCNEKNAYRENIPLAEADLTHEKVYPVSTALNYVRNHKSFEQQHPDDLSKQETDRNIRCKDGENEFVLDLPGGNSDGYQLSSVYPDRAKSSFRDSQNVEPINDSLTSDRLSTATSPSVDDNSAVYEHPKSSFSRKSPSPSQTYSDKPSSDPREKSRTTAHLNSDAPVWSRQDNAPATTYPDTVFRSQGNIRNGLPLQDHRPTKQGHVEKLPGGRENRSTSPGSQNNNAPDASDQNNSLQDSSKNTKSYPRSNDAVTLSKVDRTGLPSLPSVKETSFSNTPRAVQASRGNAREDNYFLKQRDNSRLVVSVNVPETTTRKLSVVSDSSSSIDPDNQFEKQSMGDSVVIVKNGHNLDGLAETETDDSEVRANGATHDNRGSSKKNGNGALIGCNNKVGNGVVFEDVGKDDIDSGPCGWGKFQFDFCQKFRSAKWFLVVLTLCGACQGMAVNGFVNTVISTVERRYEISSTESGLIASCYDIMFVILVIPISYFGGLGHKPRYLGVGIFVLGIGSFVFALPHFISGYYHVENADETVCMLGHNSTTTCSSDSSSSLSNYKYFFYLGQLLHGAGATPLYTLGVTFMDENVPQRSSSFYNGIFYTGAIIGPAIGYMVGAKFLDFYTDLSVDPTSLGLDPNNPKWVGAWWIGFLISGIIGVLLSLPLLAFPSALPGSSKFALERGQETQASNQVDQTGQHRGLKDILLSLKYLLTNIPFMFINIAAAADGILVAGFSTFMPKFIEYEFGLPAGTAALYVGLAVVPAGGGATFGGGFIVKCFNLKMRGILRLCTVMSFILCTLVVALLMECDTTPFAGVTLPYGQTDVGAATFLGKNLVNSCNQNCACAEEDFFPVCGRDKVLYFSPCYAGCTHVTSDGSSKKYSNCSCINYNLTAEDYSTGNTHLAEFGKCEFKCKWLPLFLVLFGFMIVFVFITSMPSLTATLRCVPDHQRSFGLGIQWIVARCLGSIPGPILFGKMFDYACLVWQKRCSGDGSCFFYDTHKLSLLLLALALAFAIAAAVSFLLALCFYKVKEAEDEVILQTGQPSPQSPHKTAYHSNYCCDPQAKHTSQLDNAHIDNDYNGTNL